MKQTALILAGGQGKSLWPLSNSIKPLQFLKIYSSRSLLRESFLKITTLLPTKQIFVVTTKEYKNLVTEELPELPNDNIIIEPKPIGSLMALLLGAIYIEKQIPSSVILVSSSNQIIGEINTFKDIIEDSFRIAQKSSCLISIAIKSHKDEKLYTSLVEVGDIIYKLNQTDAYQVKSFVQISEQSNKESIEESTEEDKTESKKDNELEQTKIIEEEQPLLLDTKMCAFEVQTLLEEVSTHLPEHYNYILELYESMRKDDTEETEKIKERIYDNLDKTVLEISSGILNKSKNVLCITANFEWEEIKGWSAIAKYLKTDEYNNTISGNAIINDTRDSVILNNTEDTLGVVGVNGLIIVKNQNDTLVCGKDKDFRVKGLVEKI